jgi:hypothetical protein
MDHLLYVLWHDHWKPWIVGKLQFLGLLLGSILIPLGVFFVAILLTIVVDKLLLNWG